MTDPRPRIALLATGGTIAGTASSAADTTGYTAGTLSAAALLAAVPGIEDVAEIVAEQVFNLDSRDMEPSHWIRLAQRVREVLADPAIAGVVITHGTDTLEESAAFLDATLAPDKPVVLTGAIRPATALSADGPMNLYNAVCVAAHAQAGGRGVLASFGAAVFTARGLRKRHTSHPDAFDAGPGGQVGQTAPARFFAPPGPRRAPLALPETQDGLPRVDILYVAAGSAPEALDQAVAGGARGVVLALPGNGSVPQRWRSPILRATSAGITIVRASRTGAGPVMPLADDQALHTIPAGGHPPSAARVLLMLALAQGGDPAKLLP